MLKTIPIFAYILFAFACFGSRLYAQPTWTLDPFGKEKKPQQYEEKKLASEKTGDKKLTTFRKILQNTTTHYNFYYNANNKLNAVIERAKLSQKDDYSQLLSFYPYTIENTAAQKTDLDSVIYKSTAGLLLHDLRSDWVDNMYLLIGKSYYLRNEMDSAALTFQFINYNLFPRKKKEDDSRIVGTNDAPGSGGLSIANKEKLNILQKTFSLPPSRNDALIWLARTFTAQEAYGDAAGLINILRNDKNLPGRLKSDLEEVTAFWFFSQNNYDSAAAHLESGLDNADNKQDKSRWEFLLAQLFEMNGQFDKASTYYNMASKHTTDLVMDINARLNDAKMLRSDADSVQLKKSISNLVAMAKKDRFENYRDIVYYSAAQLSLKKPDTAAAILYLTRATKYSTSNIPYRNKSYLQLGDLAYGQQRFKDAASSYDSLQLSPDIYADSLIINEISDRKEALAKLVLNIDAIEKEDSLQRIAALAPAERDAYVKKLLKKIRREKGIKEEDAFEGNTPITFAGSKAAENTDLFETNSKGEWYFYNTGLRSKGLAEFTRKWGKRTNTDNWRRKKSATPANLNTSPGGDPSVAVPLKDSAAAIAELNFDAMMANLPLTAEKLDSSNSIIAVNMLEEGKIFQNDLQEYPAAIDKYEAFLARFPKHRNESEAYLGLYFCYSKLGNTAQAEYYKKQLTGKYPASGAATLILNPSLLNPKAKNPEVTARYEAIYDLFIEGRFADAIDAKKKADSLHGSNYWTPQLLYIQAVHYIKEKQDSNAVSVLQDLQALYPESPLKDKAATLIEVLGRRAEIEEYLTKLEVTRKEEDKIIIAEEKAPQKTAVAAPIAVTPKKVEATIKPLTVRDTTAIKPVSSNAGFSIQPELKHYVVMLLNKVDGVYINEAKNAFTRFNKGSYLTQAIVVSRDTLSVERTLLLFSPFDDAETAIKYFDKVKKAAPGEVSWLPANKYSFFIISENNLQLLKTNKDLDGYRQLLNSTFGNKF
jgi:outer membrane protein assembly factor BamD (BamD/ComL family)